MGKVFAVGVGPGSPDYVTETVRKIIVGADVVVGYEYTLKTISNLVLDKKVHTITMKDQEKTYQQIKKDLSDGVLVVPFTGDVKIIPGISSIQVAASKAKVPIDKSKVITMHVTTSIEEKKLELQKALIDGYSVILVPRPWPKDPEKHFMPSEIAKYLKRSGFDTSKMKVHVFEALTTEDETGFKGMVEQLEGKEFSALSVMVFSQTTLESYINFE